MSEQESPNPFHCHPATHESARRRLVREVRALGVTDEVVLSALESVPRELFVASEFEDRAHVNAPLPIPCEQTISQPYMVALMAALVRNSRPVPLRGLLEVGAGCGYAAAVLGHLAERVHTIERHPRLVSLARQNLERAGAENVTVVEGDGSNGLEREAPFDGIIVSASGSEVPTALLQQLAEEARLVIPVGPADDVQRLLVYCRDRKGDFHSQVVAEVRFVALIVDDEDEGRGPHPPS